VGRYIAEGEASKEDPCGASRSAPMIARLTD
jgi:hypothetical protein